MTAKRPQFRLFDFQVVNEDYDNYDEYREKKFLIKMFGMNTKVKRIVFMQRILNHSFT